MDLLSYALLFFYSLVSLGLFFYGMNCYVMLFTYYRHRDRERRDTAAFLEAYWASHQDHDLPTVTTQLPIYNEKFVVTRLVASVVAMQYPKGRHRIQVLDDSDDDTAQLIARDVAQYRRQGYDIAHLRRPNREGFKAGALQFGLSHSDSELVAVFDADFVPPPDFLLRTVPHFAQGRVALVQTRWGHLNGNYSLLTRAQSIGIDGHFVIEQGARTWHGLYMNFNGTAGIWRRSAIEDAGGWQADTLTEDLDLSYRVQLRGWRMKYLNDVVTPGELPVDINGLKSQQHRWAKGSIQTARKLLPSVFRAPVGVFAKIEAAFHLTHYLIHPLMLAAALFAWPVLALTQRNSPATLLVALLLVVSTLSPSILYLCSQREAYRDWRRRIWILPALVAIGIGIALNNSRAVAEALLGRRSAFVRTPKYGVEARVTSRVAERRRIYNVSGSLGFALEFAIGIYGFATLSQYVLEGRWVATPFLLLNAVGFTAVGWLGFLHWWHGAVPWRSVPAH